MIKKILITLLTLLFMQLGVFAQRINVAFTIDKNYPMYTILAINSILVNNDSNSDYTFYIIENNLTNKNKQFMRNFVENQNQKIEFINLDTNIVDKGKYFYTFSEGKRITPIGMARIIIPEILPKDIERVIYLDGDTLITGDLKDLYNYDLGNNYVGMAKNIGHLEYKMYKFDTYFNSGVIVMDLNKLRKNDVSNKMIEYLSTHSEEFIYDGQTDNSVYLYPDQDLINIILDGKIKKLDQNWNNQTIGQIALVNCNLRGILHYIGPIKPWYFPKSHSYGVELYYQYWQQSPLKKYIYYYKFKSVQRTYNNMCKHKYNRYIRILKAIKGRKFTFFY